MKKILDKLTLFLFGNHEDEILENRIFHIISFTAGVTCLISVFINLLNDFPLLLNIVVAISGLIFLLFYYLSAFKKKTSRVKLPFLIILLVILPFAWFYNQGIEGSVPYYFFLVTAIFIFCLPQHKAWTILLLFIAFAVALIALQFLFPHLIIQYPDKQTQIEDLSFSLILALFILGVLIIAVKKSYDKERFKTDRISDIQIVLNDVLLLTFQEQTLNETLGKVLDIILSVKWLALDAKGSIFLVEEKPNELVLIASRNLHDSLLSTCAIVPFGRCLCGRAALNRDIIFSSCLDETHENTYTGIKPHGHYCIPIINEEKILGVINVYVKHHHLRKEEDDKFLKAFAALVAKIIVHYKTQEEIKMLAENLIEKNKDVEQFAYIISHDLQEPLRTINNFIDLIGKESKTLDEDSKQYFEFIEQATNRMRILIKNVLDYSRLGKNNQLMKVNCDTLLNDILVDLNAVIKESHAKIKFENLPVIHAFPIELKQLFQNLIVNAIKFRKKDVPPEIIITAKKVKPDWVFAVQDNGIGINKKYQEKIFQIFQRLHNRDEYEGTGIGLSFCKKIVELHEGKIWVESNEGEGSTFYFSISDTLLSA